MKNKREKYKQSQFDFTECKAQINIISSEQKGKGYATAFLNITLPDGRWLAFEIDEAHRVPLYKLEAQTQK